MTVEPTADNAPDDKRIWEGAAYTTESDTFSEDRFTLYGLDGQLVGIYRIRNRMSPPDTINMRFVTIEENVWVGKKLLKTRKGTTTEVVLQDRLGSVLFRYNANTDARKAYAYYPYGQSRGVNTPDYEDGFGTYTRLDNAENHYADQRYYNAKNGRFHQPDPYQASGGPTDPASWNRYTYVAGDPVNFFDPHGLASESPGGDLIKCVIPGGGFAFGAVCEIVYRGLFPLVSPIPVDPEPLGPVSARNQTTATHRFGTVLALENLEAGCKELLDKRYTGGVKALQSLAGDVFFYDPYAPEGALSARSETGIQSFGAELTIYELHRKEGGGNAYVLRDKSGQIPGVVILGDNFYNRTPDRRGITLVHELLHIAFQTQDHRALYESLGLTAPAGNDAEQGAAFSAFLEGGCKTQ